MTFETYIYLALGLVIGTAVARLEKWFIRGIERHYQRKEKRGES